MSFRTTVKLDSKIFNDAERRRVLSNVVTRTAKEFKQSTKDKMRNSPHTGKTYERRGGGFSRSHRASRRGERPSPDSGKLENAIVDKRTGGLSATVFVDETKAPYGEILVNKLGRDIMTSDDAREAEKAMTDRANEALRSLLL